MSNHITKTFIKNVKKLAKKIKCDLNVSHAEALEIVSKNHGYPSYHSLISRFNNQNKATKLIEHVRTTLIGIILDDIERTPTERSRSIVSHHHKESDFEQVVLSVSLDVFDTGIMHDGYNINADWLVLSWINKEFIKYFGHHLLKNDDIDGKIVGALLVALGHFYRSSVDSLVSRRLVHPNFKTYLADWLRSVGVVDDEVAAILLRLFPENSRNGLYRGTTYWKNELIQ